MSYFLIVSFEGSKVTMDREGTNIIFFREEAMGSQETISGLPGRQDP